MEERGEWERNPLALSLGGYLGWLPLCLKVTASCQAALSVMSFGPVSSPCFLQMEQLVASGFHFPLWFPTPCPYLCKVPFVSCRGPDWYNGVNKITAAVEAWASLSEKWWDCGVIHSLRAFPNHQRKTGDYINVLLQKWKYPSSEETLSTWGQGDLEEMAFGLRMDRIVLNKKTGESVSQIREERKLKKRLWKISAGWA